jgi:beta-glucanase (GH16 family)
MNSYQSSKWAESDWANGAPFNCGWLPDHVSFSNGKMVIMLDNVPSHGMPYSSCEYRTASNLNYGSFEARLKAVNHSGVVTAFFTYDNTTRDEIDLEFLGKNTQQVQANYYVGGVGNHEHMIDLGFDASADYHIYKIEWTNSYIKWYVDSSEKYTISGTALPSHPMQSMLSLWNGTGVDSWLGAFSYTNPLYAYYDYFSYTPAGTAGTIGKKNTPIKGMTELSIHQSDDALTISLPSGESGPVSVNFFNLSGKIIARFDRNFPTAGNNVFSIPLSGISGIKNLSGSCYMCCVSYNNKTVSRKISFMK